MKMYKSCDISPALTRTKGHLIPCKNVLPHERDWEQPAINQPGPVTSQKTWGIAGARLGPATHPPFPGDYR